MAIVICKLPKAGLGNQLFPLIKAYTFADLNQLPVIVLNHQQFKIGPWLRGEKSKRNYSGFFIFQRNSFEEPLKERKLIRHHRNHIVNEPGIREVDNKNNQEYYVFSSMPHWVNYFEGLKENRQLAIDLFWKIINPTIKQKIASKKEPYIGVHIRMGDFRKLNSGEAFGKVGTVRTPEEYFIEMIRNIRKIHGSLLPVSVFTDGRRGEFERLFKLKNIEMIEDNNDLVDMLLLSRSKVIVCSATSTFSYWAAFLSNAVVIMHPAYIHQSLRPNNVNDLFYEGAFDENNTQMIRQIQEIKYDQEEQY